VFEDGPTTVTTEEESRPRRSRRRRWIALALAIAVVALGGLAARVSHQGPSESGRNQLLDTGARTGRAPGFSLPDLTHATHRVTLAEFAGRPVVLNFWASWCVPCRREMPRLAAAARRFAGRVAFVGIDYEDQRDDALQFLRQTPVGYPSGFDHSGAVAQRYGLFGVPTTVFVGANGAIVGRYLGEMSQSTLDGLLGGLVVTGR